MTWQGCPTDSTSTRPADLPSAGGSAEREARRVTLRAQHEPDVPLLVAEDDGAVPAARRPGVICAELTHIRAGGCPRWRTSA